MTYNFEPVKEEFEERFGKDGPERNSDSEGRRAGCDDCDTNIEIRAQHLSFLETATKEAYEQGRKDMLDWCVLQKESEEARGEK